MHTRSHTYTHAHMDIHKEPIVHVVGIIELGSGQKCIHWLGNRAVRNTHMHTRIRIRGAIKRGGIIGAQGKSTDGLGNRYIHVLKHEHMCAMIITATTHMLGMGSANLR